MKKWNILSVVLLLGAIMIFANSCCDKVDPDTYPVSENGKIHLDFDFYVDNNPLLYDTLVYTNAAGNEYLVYEVEYFITNLSVYKDGNKIILDKWHKEHYIDTNIPSTLSWEVYDELVPGDYDSLSFTFGFADVDNQSFMFVNAPESNMIWPEYLGGGYHYMKLNGKWKAPSSNLRGFAFHIGRGQVYDTTQTPPTPISFIDNSYYVSLPNSSFTIVKSEKKQMIIRMHIDEWFKNPTIYDHDIWGGDIMQNQAAMEIGVNNGWNVFEYVEP